MRILMCNEFFYLRGGAERYMFDLMELLIRHGHEIIPFSMYSPLNCPTPYASYFVSNIDFPAIHQSRNFSDVVRAITRSLYSIEAKRSFSRLLQDTNPDLVHVFNFANYLSISILDATKHNRIPVVQSLLDYKWLCPNTTFLSQGEVCERCRNRRFYQAILRRCKRDSLSASLLASIQAYLSALTHTDDKIKLFICHSRYLFSKMVEYGYPPEKFRYVLHFLDVDSYPNSDISEPVAVYFGRFSYEKGLQTLLRAAEIAGVTVVLIGSGPEEEALKLYVREHGLNNVHFLGPKWGQEMRDIVSKARCVVCPSEWYENSPLVVYEAMAMAKPVIGADIGGIPELVQDQITGLVFRPGDSEDLAAKMRFLIDNPDIARRWGAEARRVAKDKFKPQKHYKDVLSVYKDARHLA